MASAEARIEMASRIGYSARISNLEKKARGGMEGWLNVKKEKSGKSMERKFGIRGLNRPCRACNRGSRLCIHDSEIGRASHTWSRSELANRYFQNVPAERYGWVLFFWLERVIQHIAFSASHATFMIL